MAKSAYQKAKDPEFQQSVKEKAQKAATATKEAAISAYTTAKDPEFQQKVKENLKHGVETTKKFIKGENTQVETMDFSEASEPLLPRNDPHCYSPDAPLPESRSEEMRHIDVTEIREEVKEEARKDAIEKAFSGDDIEKL